MECSGVSMRWCLLVLVMVVGKVSGSTGMTRVSSGCPDEERIGLLEIKAAFHFGKDHLDLSSWRKDSINCCSWKGVTCSNLTSTNAYVVRVTQVSFSCPGDDYPPWSLNATLFDQFQELQVLDLSYNQLTGHCELPYLEELDIRYNKLGPEIPPCIGNMTTIRGLNLGGNSFRGTIPWSGLFSGLESVEFISLSYNDFNGSFSLASLANNTRLEAFDLRGNQYPLRIETEDPLYSPPTQFKYFPLSDCMINGHQGMIPSFLRNQHDLRILELDRTDLSAEFPTWLLENNTELEVLVLKYNSFSGKFNLNSSSSYPHLSWIDVSGNHIEGEIPPSINSVFPNLLQLDMSENWMQGKIPSSMGNMRSIILLDLSHNNFIGELPESIITGCRDLKSLRLSHNALHGLLLPKARNFDSSLLFMDVSNNLITGSIPNWIGDLPYLWLLALSSNALQGPLPPSFCKLRLIYLDLSDNDIGIPRCVNVSLLEHVYLKNTSLTGNFPEFLRGASSLISLDLSRNALSGALPTWIGSFPYLRALLLKENNFESEIPQQLCLLQDITLLDLSRNNLYGIIPSCLNNITFGSHGIDRLQPLGNELPTFGPTIWYHTVELIYFSSGAMQEVELLSKARLDDYKGDDLNLMTVLDLSCNNLNGSIPSELGHLVAIKSLNLSNNHLMGSIPSTFSELKQVESLDLSYNRLSGEIPPGLVELYSLAVFSVAYNNLSGETPQQKSQFATFNEKSYEGNPFLFGPPLQACGGSDATPSLETSKASSENEEDTFKITFLWSFGGSYVVALIGTILFFSLDSYYRNKVLNLVYKFLPRMCY